MAWAQITFVTYVHCEPFIFLGSPPNKEESSSEIKSPISLVHEVALRRNLTVKFEVIRVTGPPHMRSFHTVCSVGEFSTEGIGNGKKVRAKFMEITIGFY